MTINMAATGGTSATAMDYSKIKVSGSTSLQDSSSSTTELTEEEKNYDIDGDGTLSATEKAAYLEAKSNDKALEALRKSDNAESTDTVSISNEALKMQKEGRPQEPAKTNEKMDEQNNKVSDNEQQSLMQLAISAYSKFK